MEELNITIETRLSTRTSSELINYFDDYIEYYNRILRYTWSIITKPKKQNYLCLVDERGNLKLGVLKAHLSMKYNILARVANTLIQDCKGRLNALKELKKSEQNNRKVRIKSLLKDIKGLVSRLSVLKVKVTENKASKKELKMYRGLKSKLWSKKNDLNRSRMRYKAQEKYIKEKKYWMMYGTSVLFDKQTRLKENGYRSHEGWYNAFVKRRDRNIEYVGSKDETACNVMFQVAYNACKNTFEVWVRMHGKAKAYVAGTFDFSYGNNYYRERYIEQLKEGSHPIKYRVKRRRNKWYLQVILTLEEGVTTSSENGVIGLDYNDGFISLVELDRDGELLYYEDLLIENKGTGNRAKNDTLKCVSEVMKHALGVGKSVVIEALDFKKLKSETGRARSLNKVLHRFDYSRYGVAMEVACVRNGVELLEVNPAYTSMIGRKNFMDKESGLSVHQAAAWVIGRRGLGIEDSK